MSNVCLQDPKRAPKGVKMAHSRRYVRRVDDADVWQELKFFGTAFDADAYPMPDQKDLGMRYPYTPISHTDLSRVQRHIAPSHPLGRYRGPLWIGGQKRSTASSKVEPSLSRLDPRRRQLSCFAVQRSSLPLFESLPALAFGGSVLFGQVNDYYVSYRAVLQGQTPCVWASVSLFRTVDEAHLARVLSEVKQDGLEDAGTEVWLHEQLCVDRENPRRFFLPAILLAETVCVIPHPQRWANMKGFSLVLRR